MNWISVKDALPELTTNDGIDTNYSDLIIFYSKHYGYKIGVYIKKSSIIYGKNWFCEKGYSYGNEDVTHWLTLEMPK